MKFDLELQTVLVEGDADRQVGFRNSGFDRPLYYYGSGQMGGGEWGNTIY